MNPANLQTYLDISSNIRRDPILSPDTFSLLCSLYTLAKHTGNTATLQKNANMKHFRVIASLKHLSAAGYVLLLGRDTQRHYIWKLTPEGEAALVRLGTI